MAEVLNRINCPTDSSQSPKVDNTLANSTNNSNISSSPSVSLTTKHERHPSMIQLMNGAGLGTNSKMNSITQVCYTAASSQASIEDTLVKPSPTRQKRSPRCEAFLMTGDKMLTLNPKISPHYAKLCHDQLPPASIEIYDTPTQPKKRGPFDDFPSMQKPHKVDRLHSRLKEEDDDIVESGTFKRTESTSDQCVPTSYPNTCDFQELGEDDTLHVISKTSTSANSANTLPENTTITLPSTSSTTTQNLSKTSDFRDSKLENGFKTTSNNSENPPNISESNSCVVVDDQNSLNQEQVSPDRKLLAQRAQSNSFSLRSREISSIPETSSRLALHLYSLHGGFRLTDVAGFLMKNDDFSKRIAREFMLLFNFSGKRLDAALREFLDHVCLIGESAERAHLLAQFSSRYHECNPALFKNEDEIHALTCALILLNTDLHGQNSGKKMSCREFVDNLLETNHDFDRNMLKCLYGSIKANPYKYGAEAQLQQEQQHLMEQDRRLKKNGSMGKDSSNPMMPMSSNSTALATTSTRNSLLIINPNEQVDYKHGYVLKKSVYDSDGTKTPFGRRKWQMFYATIRGMILYLHKNEHGFNGHRHEIFNHCVRLHHAFAEPARDYKKRQHVFRLRTANFGELLFQTSDSAEVQKWIEAINYVAAAFSTPALPEPVSSNSSSVAFRIPVLSSTPTTFSVPEQLRAHKERLEEMVEKLTKQRQNAPSINAKGKPVMEYFWRERYLDKERERYSTYVEVLGEKLAAS